MKIFNFSKKNLQELSILKLLCCIISIYPLRSYERFTDGKERSVKHEASLVGADSRGRSLPSPETLSKCKGEKTNENLI